MDKTGLLIRRLRIERKLSQRALCEGICAVSYLSKIEKGAANPGEEIVRLLFARLGVDYRLDEAFVRDTRRILDRYFEHVAYFEDEREEKEQLLEVRDQALQSPLADAYTLFLIYEAFGARQWMQAKELLGSPALREADMGEQDLFFYALARGETADAPADAMTWYQMAVRLRSYSIARFFLGKMLYRIGRYQESLSHLQQGYALAAEEGCAYILLYIADLMAGCYAELYQEDMMMRHYQQARRLAQVIAPQMIAGIDYNIGATLVSMRKSAQALPYLNRARQGRYKASVLLCHKLSIAYFDTGNRKEAIKALHKADALLKAGKGTPMEAKLIRIVRFRLEKDYLKSEEYYRLLREVYDGIDKVFHHGFKQFHGNLLVEACVHSRRYKEALRIAAEVGIFPEFIQ